MKEIPLTQGKVALVDDGDYERVSQYKWFAVLYPGNHWYAERTHSGSLHRHSESLHRFLMNPPARLMVDHVNGDGLDCQRHNMRLATNAQNQYNARMRTDNTSGFRGVYPVKLKSGETAWKVVLNVQQVQTYLGLYKSPEEAAKAYDQKVLETRSEFGRLNFPI